MFDSEVTAGPSGPAPESHWEQFFAWLPVRVHGKRKWLTKVWRKKIWAYGDQRNNNPFYYKYSTMFDVIKDEE